MSKIGPAELDESRAEGSVFVLDVRNADDYERRHIDGSHNAPIYDALRGGESEALDDYLGDVPRNAEVVTVCKAGVVARRATDYLNEHGYEARTLAGGYAGWRRYKEGGIVYRVLAGLGILS